MKPEADIIERITKQAIAESVARWPESSGYAYACGVLQGEMLDILRQVPEAMKYFLDKFSVKQDELLTSHDDGT